MLIRTKLSQVEERILVACERSGRNRNDITIIAVTKYVSTDRANEALQNNLWHLGENRWQDARAKWEELQQLQHTDAHLSTKPVWHFIGSLQSNKAKEVVGRFDYIHSLDRISLAEAIQKRAEALGITVPCFIQVNVSGEDSKQGIEPDQLTAFIDQLGQYSAIKPIGLMTMAPYEADPESTRPVFRALRELRDHIQSNSGGTSPIRELSMGMSNDFEVAIEEGATWIRLGTILVGEEEE